MANAASSIDGRDIRSTSTDGSPCSLPLDVVPESVYHEYTPHAALKPYLVCAWTLEIPAGRGEHRQRVLPDGCSDVLWIGDKAPAVVGPMTRSRLSSLAPGTTIVGLRFRPEAAAFSRLGLTNQIVLVNGNIGVVARLPDGRPLSVVAFTIAGGRVVEMDILADPERLSRLDLSAVEG